MAYCMTKAKNPYRKEIIYGATFAAILLATLLTAIGLAFASSGPIVLGTEMNTNGLVEYLCLGRGCETYTAMDW